MILVVKDSVQKTVVERRKRLYRYEGEHIQKWKVSFIIELKIEGVVQHA